MANTQPGSCRTTKLEKTTEWGKIEQPHVQNRGIKRSGFSKEMCEAQKGKGENWVLWVGEQCEHSLEAGS